MGRPVDDGTNLQHNGTLAILRYLHIHHSNRGRLGSVGTRGKAYAPCSSEKRLLQQERPTIRDDKRSGTGRSPSIALLVGVCGVVRHHMTPFTDSSSKWEAGLRRRRVQGCAVVRAIQRNSWNYTREITFCRVPIVSFSFVAELEPSASSVW
ncbi:hypothetical protein OH77DRAFT_877284 [Trametes cingulata]|nr:hypothetical protein OH77DRAFT_877284 [Trametes cingulata]